MLKKIFFLLSRQEKKKIILLIFLSMIMAFFDILGVSSIVPFLSLLINPELITNNEALIQLYNLSLSIGISDQKQFIFLFGIIVFFLIIISLIMRAITIYALTLFSLMQEYSIGKRLVEGYLRQNYSWFLNRNSSELGKSILSEVKQVIDYALFPMINLITHTIVATALLSVLVINNSQLAITVGISLLAFYGMLLILMKNFLTHSGSQRLQANEARFEAVSEAFGAAKEVKLGGLEQVYIDRFSKPAKIYSRSQAWATIIAILPRYIIEVIAIGGMFILILILMFNGGSFLSIIPTIGLYAFVGYRLMPVLQQIYNSITRLRFSKIALDTLYNDIKKIKSFEINDIENLYSNIEFKKSICLSNVSFSYSNSDKKSLEDINILINAYSNIGIVGTTGSGKTTIVDIILGLFDCEIGTLKVDDTVINSKNKRSWQRILGYVPQQIFLSDNSISSNIAFGIDPKKINLKQIESVAKIANLHDFIKRLPERYNTIIGERGVRLSGGERQRIGIARALYHNPKLIIFDEATSALDNITEKKVLNEIDNLKDKVTIIMVAHRLSTVKNCDLIFILEDGKIISKGTYKELISKSEKFKKMIELN
jgi:ABC-type multidrug transport system fused ATPase/permease subunit